MDTPPVESAEQLRERIKLLEADNSKLRFERAQAETALVDNAGKWREKMQALDNELRIAQKGFSSGCGCPIGQCLRRNPTKEGCWMQWAEAHLIGRLADRRLGEILRGANHPSRFRGAPPERAVTHEAGTTKPNEDGLVLEEGIRDYGSRSSSTTGRNAERDPIDSDD